MLALPDGWFVTSDMEFHPTYMVVPISVDNSMPELNCCGRPQWCRNGKGSVRLRHHRCGGRDVELVVTFSRWRCEGCGRNIGNAVECLNLQRTGFTNTFIDEIGLFAACHTVQDAAREFAISWNICKSIKKAYLEQLLSQREAVNPRYLSIDGVKMAGKTAGIIYDIERGIRIGITEIDNAKHIEDYLRQHSEWADTLLAVCVDAKNDYRLAVNRVFPRAVIVLNRFHFVSYLRRQVRKYAAERKIIDGLRYDLRRLEKRGTNLQERKAIVKLGYPEILSAFDYILKLDELYTQNSKAAARRYWSAWIDNMSEDVKRVIGKEAARLNKSWASEICNAVEFKRPDGSILMNNSGIEVSNRDISMMRYIGGRMKFETLRLSLLAYPQHEVSARSHKRWEAMYDSKPQREPDFVDEGTDDGTLV